MAKGAARDAKKEAQHLGIFIDTETFITLGKLLDPEFKITREDTIVKRAKGTATIHPMEADVTAIEKWIVETIRIEADKAYKQKQKEKQALMESMKEELIASGWTPPKESSASKKTTK